MKAFDIFRIIQKRKLLIYPVLLKKESIWYIPYYSKTKAFDIFRIIQKRKLLIYPVLLKKKAFDIFRNVQKWKHLIYFVLFWLTSQPIVFQESFICNK